MVEEPVCRECRKPIPIGARKCTSCSSFQDWRRVIFAWSGLFTALLALLPLWSGAYSLWKLAFPKPAEVKITIASCRPERVLAYLNNLGEKAAMLGQPHVEFLEAGVWSRLEETFEMDEDDLIASPDEADVITLKPAADGAFPTDDAGQCRLKVVFPILQGAIDQRSAEAVCSCES